VPAKYERLRDRLARSGRSMKAAKTLAAKIYNAQRKRGQAPVTGKHRG